MRLNVRCESLAYVWCRLLFKILVTQADHLGRRTLFIEAGFQMFIALLVIAISLARMVPAPAWLGWYVLAFILLFDSAYAWSCECAPS